MNRLKKPLAWSAWGLGGLVLVGFVGLSLFLRASLPRSDGAAEVAGLSGVVEVARDSLGIPVIRAASLEDAIRAQGYVHAQDRFFQMDLTRRAGAGELSGLLGGQAVGADRTRRLQGYTRRHAEDLLGSLPQRGRRILDAYTEGVNAGLRDLGARPPEHLLLRTRPEPWAPEDCVLVWMAVARGLSFDPAERSGAVLRAALPRELVEFLTPEVTRFDVPMVVSDTSPEGGYRPAPVPGPDVVDLRGRKPVFREGEPVVSFPPGMGGSNAWAVSGELTPEGGALVASDPHVGRSVPPYFYRVELAWRGRSAFGASVAGLPGIIIGSTHDLAWGVTNGWTDQRDEVVVTVDPADSTQYLTPEGPEPFRSRRQIIPVRGGEADTTLVRTTRWGPVHDRDWKGRPLVRRNAALAEAPFVVPLMDLLLSRTVEQGVGSVRHLGGASSVVVLADAGGSVGWALTGNHPRREGFDGSRSVSWADADRGWNGMLDGTELPSSVDPSDGRVYHSNNRPVGVDLYSQIRFLPVLRGRAMRVRALLGGRDLFDESTFERMQTDLRAPIYEDLRRLVLRSVDAGDSDTLLRRVRRHVEEWDGTGAPDQVGFRLLDAYFGALQEAVLAPLLAPARQADPNFSFYTGKSWESVLRLLEERPSHMRPPDYATWRALLRSTLRDVALAMEQDPETAGLDGAWGEVTHVRYMHPLGAVPLIGGRLNVEPFPSSGNPLTVQNRSPPVGQVLRLVVNPARVERGRFHMPVGQSGHFLSPHYDDFHASWAEKELRPLVAGPPESSFVLRPAQ